MMRFSVKILTAVAVLFISSQATKAQVNVVLEKSFALPAENGKIQALQLLEDGTPVIVMNGGVYLPTDKAWLIAPDAQQPVLDVAVLKDASGIHKLCVLQMRDDKTELRALHRIEEGQPKFRTAQILPLGLFHFAVIDSATTILWGKEKSSNVIYASTLQQMKKLHEIDASISSLLPFTGNSLLTSMAGNLFVITADGQMKPLATVPAPVISMTLDAAANIWISTLQGVYLLENGQQQFKGPMMDNSMGLLQASQSQLWLADPQKRTLNLYRLK